MSSFGRTPFSASTRSAFESSVSAVRSVVGSGSGIAVIVTKGFRTSLGATPVGYASKRKARPAWMAVSFATWGAVTLPMCHDFKGNDHGASLGGKAAGGRGGASGGAGSSAGGEHPGGAGDVSSGIGGDQAGES